MAHTLHYSCPNCDLTIDPPQADGELFVCPECGSRYTVLIDEATGRTAMVDQDTHRPAPPLFLPSGSVRALISLTLAGTFWALVFHSMAVPGYLTNLLLTIVGYYFGFRSDRGQGRVVVFDAAAEKERPLALPSGVIRLIMIAGFAAAGVALYVQGRLGELDYVEFFVVLAGLLLGMVFGRSVAKVARSPVMAAINHLKALAVLGLTGLLAWALLTGQHAHLDARGMMVLCAVVSFYFGSRT